MEVGIEQAHQTSSQHSVRGKWQRYHMISASMVGAPVDKMDLSVSISAAIDQEASHRRNPLIDMAGSAGRFAIAASVAMVAILGVQQLNSPDPASADALQFAEMDISSDELTELHKEFFILFNIAVGGTHAGRPDDTTNFPQHMYVDWVRVYEKVIN